MPSLSIVALPPAHFLTADAPAALRSTIPALRYFEAVHLEEARPAARAQYAAAERCERCRNVLAQRFERLGSTLFRDDDPRALVRAFDAADRDACTVRLLASCIVLFGRERVRLH